VIFPFTWRSAREKFGFFMSSMRFLEAILLLGVTA